MEADYLGPYSHKAICRQEYNWHAYRVEHGFGADIVSALNDPVNINTYSLSGYGDEEEVGKNEAVEGLNFALESGHNSYGCVYGISQEEVHYALSEKAVNKWKEESSPIR